MYKSLFFSVLLLPTFLFGQSSVRLEINSLPPYHPSGSDIYIAGSFNGWNPQDTKYKFQHGLDGKYSIELTLDNGTYEYKITRGGWDNVECKKGGTGIENRIIKVEGPATIQVDIEEWQDRFPAKPRINTASRNVRVIDTAFLIPQLNRVRRVSIYLPADYTSSRKKYPVLYMQDGQNVFDDATSYAGEWGVDEFLDSNEIKKCIVVTIDHGDNKRFNEYSPYDHERFGKGEGDLYAEFITMTLKRYIDKNYRTKKGRKNTFIAGSSMGGLISLYAVLKYPKVFGGAGVFSPSFWVAPRIYEDIRAKARKVKARIYFYAGKHESETMAPETLRAFAGMAGVSKSKMKTVIRDEGRHNEASWRKEFPLFYEWLLK